MISGVAEMVDFMTLNPKVHGSSPCAGTNDLLRTVIRDHLELQSSPMLSVPRTTRDREPWNHNLEYQSWLLEQVPVPCEHALDVGCGDGWLARRLANRGVRVAGIDVSEPMVDRAR